MVHVAPLRPLVAGMVLVFASPTLGAEKAELRADGGWKPVEARRPGRKQPVVLFAGEPADTFAFHRFDARTTIRQIGVELAAFMSWDADRGFSHVRQLFLRLVHLGVCVPGNPMD